MSDIRCQKDDVGSGMLEYPKGTVKEEYRMEEGRWKMLDVAIRIHMSKETRNLGESFDGRGLRCLMYDV